jgi:hypothetical protein
LYRGRGAAAGLMGGHHTIRLMRLMRLIQTVIIRLQIVFLAFRFRAGPFAQNPFSKIFHSYFSVIKSTYLKNLYIVKSYLCGTSFPVIKKYILEESLFLSSMKILHAL